MTEADISTQIVCRVCKESKQVDSYPKSATGKYGRTTRCKPCTAVYLKKYQQKNEKELRVKDKVRYADNREKALAARKADYEKNKEAYKARAAKWARQNPGKRKLVTTKYLRENPEKRQESNKKHRLENPGMYAAHFKKRQQRKRQACPAWADPYAMAAIYETSARLTKTTGVKHHVDHYYPLTSDIVCGLHNEFNLRVIPARDNLAKANSFPED